MKTTTLTLLVTLFVTILTSSTFAQQQMTTQTETPEQIYKRFEASGQVAKPSLKSAEKPADLQKREARGITSQMSATADKRSGGVLATIFSPIDSTTAESLAKGGGSGSASLVAMHMDHEVVSRGQAINFSLVSIGSHSGPISSVCQVLEPGYSMQYDEGGVEKYFSPNIGEGGYLPKGINYGQTFLNFYTRLFAPGDREGQHYISCLFYNSNSGTLLQQTASYFFYSQAGPGDLWYTRVDSAIQTKAGSTSLILVKGQFPIGQQLMLLLGKPDPNQGMTQYLAYSNDGQTILLVAPYSPYRAREYDITVVNLDWRLHQTKPAAFTLSGTQNQ